MTKNKKLIIALVASLILLAAGLVMLTPQGKKLVGIKKTKQQIYEECSKQSEADRAKGVVHIQDPCNPREIQERFDRQ